MTRKNIIKSISWKFISRIFKNGGTYFLFFGTLPLISRLSMDGCTTGVRGKQCGKVGSLENLCNCDR